MEYGFEWENGHEKYTCYDENMILCSKYGHHYAHEVYRVLIVTVRHSHHDSQLPIGRFPDLILWLGLYVELEVPTIGHIYTFTQIANFESPYYCLFENEQ